ncbi:uncharacterized protein B0I36DRAFT_354265 [Microdochium trichocladiopsis]|uniref:Uncharacterized protein n=1 Tax=Microdochium trichocladiopsis TaxID=1682393 RepID=A0A9P8XWV0_9PEZI|nr:uncharacterized protein B0I36DRAFT_356633 [Microdochium trichocladiopsis]XP_046007851.1 uncharacterized protein B0I36DRAFT_354265 [Microdochium trichocladiopsis]KAH7009391.1 hypothetical protein B0I36DRAFT_356633 [Microdochium trichocladiopsis]KAH7021650.1 hypothetical protein B0I36DRAFT_354265 [Microdochium trichocladiopsis]
MYYYPQDRTAPPKPTFLVFTLLPPDAGNFPASPCYIVGVLRRGEVPISRHTISFFKIPEKEPPKQCPEPPELPTQHKVATPLPPERLEPPELPHYKVTVPLPPKRFELFTFSVSLFPSQPDPKPLHDFGEITISTTQGVSELWLNARELTSWITSAQSRDGVSVACTTDYPSLLTINLPEPPLALPASQLTISRADDEDCRTLPHDLSRLQEIAECERNAQSELFGVVQQLYNELSSMLSRATPQPTMPMLPAGAQTPIVPEAGVIPPKSAARLKSNSMDKKAKTIKKGPKGIFLSSDTG